ncbi:2OG-Fe dioxygenase family protein [Staphylococcus simulans]|uniref:2OG-Fe dioxygenase family protein n=1 Tax=Staphylococcus simulans TaxID=1286 RepID=UPI00399A834E
MSKIKERGYAKYNLMQDLQYEGIDYDYKELLNSFENLPEDTYALGLNRYRQYSRAIILPGTMEIFWLPTLKKDNEEYSAYFQGKFNPEHPGAYREFHALDSKIKNNKLLNKIILADYKETFWNEEDKILPIHVGVHFVKLFVENEGDKAVSSPDCLHQDGEPFTFAHLIERTNVIGGTNVIAVPSAAGNKPEDIADKNIIETFEISQPLESYGVDDSAVSHYVSPINKKCNHTPTIFSLLLLDYQPTLILSNGESYEI